jgi:phosphoribosylanthranilate isomerase
MVRIKICGNRTLRDAEIAVRYGADAIGLIVGTKFFSEDEVSTSNASEIVAALPPFIVSVLVTHLQSGHEILDLYHAVLPTTIQLHNEVNLSVIEELRCKIPHVKLIKAIHIVDSTAIKQALMISNCVDSILLDSRTDGRIGGTGVTHDWSVSQQIVLQTKVPVILAGGLTPSNVGLAIAKVKPFAVDVNSGVDAPNGDKDPQKVLGFIESCRKEARLAS